MAPQRVVSALLLRTGVVQACGSDIGVVQNLRNHVERQGMVLVVERVVGPSSAQRVRGHLGAVSAHRIAAVAWNERDARTDRAPLDEFGDGAAMYLLARAAEQDERGVLGGERRPKTGVLLRRLPLPGAVATQ